MDQFLCGGFAIATGDCQKRDLELLPVVFGQLLQGGQYICYKNGFSSVLISRIINHRKSGTGLQSLLRKSIAIKVVSFECKEKITGLQFPGIGLNGWMLQKYLIEFIDLHGTKVSQPGVEEKLTADLPVGRQGTGGRSL
jgi:nitric oxide synthase oxygenase domain/subunit